MAVTMGGTMCPNSFCDSCLPVCQQLELNLVFSDYSEFEFEISIDCNTFFEIKYRNFEVEATPDGMDMGMEACD